MTVKPSAEGASAKTDASSAEGAKAFSSLLQSLAEGLQHGKDQETALPKALLKKIEDMLAKLQEQPVEELTEAQQKIMYELMQIMNVQPERKEGTILVDTTGRRKFTPLFPDPPKDQVSKDVQAKLVELVKKLADILPASSTADTKKFDASSPFMGVDAKATVLNTENIANITKKIMEFTESLSAAAKNTPSATAQIEQAAKLGMISATDTEKQVKVSGEMKSGGADEPEASKAQTSAAVVTAARSDGGQQQEASQQDDTKQNLTQTTVSADSAKPAAAPAAQPLQARPEPTPMPTPMVRMNNLTEELGEVFKNSMRMSTNGESTQIKVNISPDHLGHLDIRLTETNGKIAAQIFTSSIAAKDALDLQLNQLRQTLVQQGLNVEKIEVVQNNSQQSLGQQNAQAEQHFAQQRQRQNSTGRENNGYQQLEEKAAVERSHLDSGMMKVDYTV